MTEMRPTLPSAPALSHSDVADGTPAARSTVWPVPAASLAALEDLGMSDAAIGRYFGVDIGTVNDARRQRS